MSRRDFIRATPGIVDGLTLGGTVFGAIREEHFKLGIDGYSTRGFRWNAIQLMDYAVSSQADDLVALKEQQRFDLERNLDYTKKTLDVGMNRRKGL